jgi:hypothetical protein
MDLSARCMTGTKTMKEAGYTLLGSCKPLNFRVPK